MGALSKLVPGPSASSPISSMPSVGLKDPQTLTLRLSEHSKLRLGHFRMDPEYGAYALEPLPKIIFIFPGYPIIFS